jgi:glyoxylase-like metal-dependent hydrolase (beta-lactamase superfamily II)
MHRRTLIAGSVYAAGALALVGGAGVAALAGLGARPARAQGQDFSKVEVQATPLSPTVHMLTGAGGNIGLSAGDDAVFVVDDQFAPLAPKIKAAIARITPKPVQFVLNTHFHFDHTGGNEAFAREGALIVAHDNVRRRLSSEQLIALAGRTSRQAPTPKAGLPVVTVAGELTFHINGDEVHAFHVPRAHTDGDLVVHFRKSDVVHMGDIYFNGLYPFIDVGSGGTAEGVLAAADRVLALAGERTKIIPGHGPLASRADLQTWRDMLATAVQRVKEARRAGKSDDEFRNSRPFADFDERYGKGFINPQTFVAMMQAAVPR